MVKCFFFSCPFLHLFFPFLYSYNFFPFPIFIQFSNLQKWGKMHPPRSCILKDRNCRSHSKTVSHLIWDFVCLNKISVVPLALTIPFSFSQPIDAVEIGLWCPQVCYLKWQLNSTRSGQIFCYDSKWKGNTSEQGLMEVNSVQEHFLWFFFKINCIGSSSIFPQRCVRPQAEELELVMDASLNQSIIRIPFQKVCTSK